MTNVYNTEPPTCGKVILRTNFGDVDIELWSKEAPLACRNFVQLSLEGYYDNMHIHRIIKDFMLQTGDPSGSGSGGESIWSKPFKDEIHGRIRFNHRGQVAMANENTPHSNRSQFFITLGACEWLNKKHTIFGKVTGNTIYNVMRLNDTEVNNSTDCRPIDISTVVVKTVEVLWNPFEDITPRNIQSQKSTTSATVHVIKPVVAVKDKKLLSFADDEEGENEDMEGSLFEKKGMHSSHSSTLKPVNSKLVDKPAYDSSMLEKSDRKVESHASHDRRRTADVESQVVPKVEAIVPLPVAPSAPAIERHVSKPVVSEDTEDITEFEQMKRELLKSKRAIRVITGEEAATNEKETAFHDMTSLVEQRRLKYLKRKKTIGDRENDTLSKLESFKSKLKGNDAKPVSAEKDGDEDQGEDDVDGNDWCKGKLKFVHHPDDKFRNN